MKHLNITVTGRVQGVFFRASTKQKADTLGIEGFVRNLEDGSVYIEAEGSEAGLKQLLNWLAVGPPGAHVERVLAEEDEVKFLDDFIISR